ncbi:MAG TPA: winged helix-turn-helix domain-containing protein [Rhodocyclaceae bacterium]|jgi:two-component system OmpR family response regulator/two-component system response regulator QseB|nr:winged helix-turn-helix domain-containing protein [Betaproteobacteria bacterium]HMV01296.1 winged helix-turn-helix domain-containing protein [Rhodocyclaceae bacterium]HMV20819.1 winged helix-turn-helix domain-containing protein [Rhodocyclaceae bacterium]HNE43866.1 winged helix-turn-helix domain-containing protein [Rhodocyclaceae bacterium]HNM80659.1 winged helix-turn-helix domain-containing protein [Rhodocyclaceae bacterium]
MRLLIVEDDPLLGDALQAGMTQSGFAVDWVTDGVAAEAALAGELAARYEAVVLDLGLPRRDGLTVLRGLRSRGCRLPVLVLTARDAVEDRIAGLDSGADDYCLKPFDMGELAARLRALIRRSEGQPTPVLEASGVRLDPASHAVSVDGQSVELAAKEFALLHALLLNAGRVLSRSQLEERLYSWNDETGSNTVEVYIHHLRRKLGKDLIRTIRGVGYLVRKD